MGKGNDPNCHSADHTMNILGFEEAGVAVVEEVVEESVEKVDYFPDSEPSPFEEMSSEWEAFESSGGEQEIDKLAEAKARSRRQQEKRRTRAAEVIDRIDSGEEDPNKVLEDFKAESDIEPVTSSDERMLQRLEMLDRPSSHKRAMDYRRDRMNPVEELIARKARSQLQPDSGVEGLRFIERFIKAQGFRAHLTNVMAEELYRLEDDAPGGKDVENSFREASIRNIDAEDLAISTGYWRDPDTGDEYYVEVMREHSSTALFDLVINVTDMKTRETFQSPLQFKSYKNVVELAEGEKPIPGLVKEPEDGHRSVKVSNSTKAAMAGDAAAIARETRIRVTATESYLSVEPTVQSRTAEDGSKVPVMVTNNTIATHPALHDAIAKCSDLEERFKPVRKTGQTRDGKKQPDYYVLQAEIDVPMPDGSVEKATITHDSKLQANKRGIAKDSNGNYKTMAGGSGGIIMDVSDGLVVPFFKECFHTRPVAEVLAREEYQD